MKKAVNFRILMLLHLLGLLLTGVLYVTSVADGLVIKMIFAILFFSMLVQWLVHRFRPGWYNDKINRQPHLPEKKDK